MIRVFIVASSPLARAGLKNLLATRDVEVAGSVADFESLIEQWPERQADIVLLETPGEQFKALIDSLAASQLSSDTTVVILASGTEPRFLTEALRAGVRAILPSDISPDRLVAALEAAAAGLVVLYPQEAGLMFSGAELTTRRYAELAEPLTPRESEVLQMLASGLANKEIAAKLAISEHTVKFHVASILGKLGAGSRTEAVALGIRRGLVLL